MNYVTERYETTVQIPEYVEACVAVEEFLPYCKECNNYGKIWSCPGYDFDPYDYWKQYQTLHIIGIKILLPEEYAGKRIAPEESRRISEEIIRIEKRKLTEELYEMEKIHPGSVSLSAGCCESCGRGNCARVHNEPCRYPEKLRYSIESLGGNVGLTVTKYLHQKLEWIEEGRMPHYFILVCGLLKK